MYRIIGSDGKEYGPITADQVRQWIVEGRANAQTRILLEGTTVWKTIGELPEFGLGGAATPGVLPTYTAAPLSADPALVSGPATGLIIVAILGFFVQAINLVLHNALASMLAQQTQNMPMAGLMSGGIAVGQAIVGCLGGILILVGAFKMKKLENYGLAMAASIIAMIPCISPCCWLGLPIGIWAVMILNKPEVKSAFH